MTASATSKSAAGTGTKADPWRLKTPSGTSDYTLYRDETLDPPALVCIVGTTVLRYHLRCIEDLHAMLKQHDDWMLLGSADEQKPAAPGTVEAWARSADNPVGGWYGLKKGLRGRFATALPHPAADEIARPRRSGAQHQKQPHARQAIGYRAVPDTPQHLRACPALLLPR